MANGKRGEEGGRGEQLGRGRVALATEEMSNGCRGEAEGRVERKSIDVPKERSRDYQREEGIKREERYIDGGTEI